MTYTAIGVYVFHRHTFPPGILFYLLHRIKYSYKKNINKFIFDTVMSKIPLIEMQVISIRWVDAEIKKNIRKWVVSRTVRVESFVNLCINVRAYVHCKKKKKTYYQDNNK